MRNQLILITLCMYAKVIVVLKQDNKFLIVMAECVIEIFYWIMAFVIMIIDMIHLNLDCEEIDKGLIQISYQKMI